MKKITKNIASFLRSFKIDEINKHKLQQKIFHLQEFIVCLLNGIYEIIWLAIKMIDTKEYHDDNELKYLILFIGQFLLIIFSYFANYNNKKSILNRFIQLYMIFFTLEYSFQTIDEDRFRYQFNIFYIILILILKKINKSHVILITYCLVFSFLIARLVISTLIIESIYTLFISILVSILIISNYQYGQVDQMTHLPSKSEKIKSIILNQKADEDKQNFQNQTFQQYNNSILDYDMSILKKRSNNQSCYQSEREKINSEDEDYNITSLILKQIKTGIALIDSNFQMLYINGQMKRSFTSSDADTIIQKLLKIQIKQKIEPPLIQQKFQSIKPQETLREYQNHNNPSTHDIPTFKELYNNNQRTNYNSLLSINAAHPANTIFSNNTHSNFMNQSVAKTNNKYESNSDKNSNGFATNLKKQNLYIKNKNYSKTIELDNQYSSEKLIKDKGFTKKMSLFTTYKQESEQNSPKSCQLGVFHQMSDSRSTINCKDITFIKQKYSKSSVKNKESQQKQSIQNLQQLLIPPNISDLFTKEELNLKDILVFLIDNQEKGGKCNYWSLNDLNDKKKSNDSQKIQMDQSTQKQTNDLIYFIDNNSLIINFKENKEKSNFIKLRIGFFTSKNYVNGPEKPQDGLILIELFDENKFQRTIEDHEINEYKNRMLASVSHELRTPLNCSIPMLQILLNKFSDSYFQLDGEDVRDTLIKPALNSNLLLLNIINDILDYGQINAGKLEMVFEQFNIMQVITDCTDLICFQASLKGLKINIQLDGNLPEIINSDQNRLRQVLLNLLSNSLKFTDKGYITIIVSQDIYNYDLIRIDVSDSGCGIQPENLQKVLEAFGNKQASKNLNTAGAGFGMSIANNLALGLGGNRKIEISSKVNEGTTFSFYVVNRSANKKGCQYKLKDMFSQRVAKWESINKLDYPNSPMASFKAGAQKQFKSLRTSQQFYQEMSNNWKIELDKHQTHQSQKFNEENNSFESVTHLNLKHTNTISMSWKPSSKYIDSNKGRPYSTSQAQSQQPNSSSFDFKSSKHMTTTKGSKKRNSLLEANECIFVSDFNNEKSQQQYQISTKSEQRSSEKQQNPESCQILEGTQSEEGTTQTENIFPSKLMVNYFLESKLNIDDFPSYLKRRKSVDSSYNGESKSDVFDQRNSYTYISSGMQKNNIKNHSTAPNSQKRMSFDLNSQHIVKKLVEVQNNALFNNMSNINGNNLQGHINIHQDAIKKLKQINQQLKCNCSPILIVDDNDFNIYALQLRLKMYGFCPDTVTSGVLAIEKVIKKFKESMCCQKYTLIFMDIDMPIKNGFETTKEILKFFKKMKSPSPIISACTAYVQDSEKIKAQQIGMKYYLTKPIIESEFDLVLLKAFDLLI